MISESGLWWFVRIATIIPKREHKEVQEVVIFFFEGRSIYSYGYHFEVGRIVRNKCGKKAYLLEVESRAMLLIDLLDKKVLTLSDLNLKSLNRI